MNPAYRIEVFYSDEDEVWIADVPDLPLCSAHGRPLMTPSPRSNTPSKPGWTPLVPWVGQSRSHPAGPPWPDLDESPVATFAPA